MKKILIASLLTLYVAPVVATPHETNYNPTTIQEVETSAIRNDPNATQGSPFAWYNDEYETLVTPDDIKRHASEYWFLAAQQFLTNKYCAPLSSEPNLAVAIITCPDNTMFCEKYDNPFESGYDSTDPNSISKRKNVECQNAVAGYDERSQRISGHPFTCLILEQKESYQQQAYIDMETGRYIDVVGQTENKNTRKPSYVKKVNLSNAMNDYNTFCNSPFYYYDYYGDNAFYTATKNPDAENWEPHPIGTVDAGQEKERVIEQTEEIKKHEQDSTHKKGEIVATEEVKPEDITTSGEDEESVTTPTPNATSPAPENSSTETPAETEPGDNKKKNTSNADRHVPTDAEIAELEDKAKAAKENETSLANRAIGRSRTR